MTDTRTLRLGNYLGTLTAPPQAVCWSKNVPQYGMLMNDQLGDCTIAGALHLRQVLAAAAGNPWTPTDAEALQAYEQIDGYVQGNSSTDNGGILLNVLNAWKQNGIAGHTILGFASVNVQDFTEVMQAIALFGGLYTGKLLPKSAQTEDVWHDISPNDGGVWGGHCTPDTDYDQGTVDGSTATTLGLITWGAVKEETLAFFQRYTDEAYVVIDPVFIEATGLSASGVNLAQLQADLALIH